MIRILFSMRLGELRRTQADLACKTGIRPSIINEMYGVTICRRSASPPARFMWHDLAAGRAMSC